MGEFTCPKCANLKTIVYETLPILDGLRRRRRCQCGYKFFSFEFVEGHTDRYLAENNRQQLRRARDILKDLIAVSGPRPSLLELSKLLKELSREG